MLRHILLAALLIFAGVAHGHSHKKVNDDDVIPTSDNRPVPWPLAYAQPFPWDDIQGLWKIEQDGEVSYFAFKVVKEKTGGGRQLLVRQIDGKTLRVLAEGVGFETGQVILAQMTSCGGSAYRLRLTSIRREDSPQPPVMGNLYTGSVMVLSIGNLDARSLDDMVHLQMAKVSSSFRFTDNSCQAQ